VWKIARFDVIKGGWYKNFAQEGRQEGGVKMGSKESLRMRKKRRRKKMEKL
jgi:hypothetical protein